VENAILHARQDFVVALSDFQALQLEFVGYAPQLLLVDIGSETLAFGEHPGGRLFRRGKRFRCFPAALSSSTIVSGRDAGWGEGSDLVLANAIDLQESSSGNMLIRSSCSQWSSSPFSLAT